MRERRGKRTDSSRPAGSPPPSPAPRPGQPAPPPADMAQVRRLLVRYQLVIHRRLPVLLLTLSSAVLLTLSFEPFGLWPLAFVALVPWLTAVAAAARWRWMLFCSWLGGFVFFAVNLYWLLACGYPGPADGVLLMAAAELALAAYMGLFFLLFAYVVGGLVRRWTRPGGERGPTGMLLTWIAPIAWVAVETLRGHLLSGFPWFQLGHSLADVTTLAQIADLGGVYAVSFLAAAVNGLIADGLLQPLFLPTPKGPKPNYQVSAAALALAGMLLLTVVYGRFRIRQVNLAEHPGPRVAVVQGHYPVHLSGGADLAARFDAHLALSREAAEAHPRPDLVAWPETMVPATVNDEFLAVRWRNANEVEVGFPRSHRMDADIREQVEQADTPLLVGSVSIVPAPAGWADGRLIDVSQLDAEPAGEPALLNPQLLRFNSAILYQPFSRNADLSRAEGREGVRAPATIPADAPAVVKSRYDKHHLVPFGELIPFRRSWPAGFRLLRNLTPMSLLSAGEDLDPLVLCGRDGRAWRLAAPICYEDVMAQAVRPLVVGPDGRKQVDLLVNISNDGWFAGTTELAQHWAIARFRCIENRVPMARSVNCGCSGFIDSLGRPIPLPGRPLGRLEPGETGWLAAVLPLDSRVTLYARIGDAGGWLCVLLLACGWSTVFIRRRRARRLERDS